MSVAHSFDSAAPTPLGDNAIEEVSVTSCRDQPREDRETHRGINAA
ncbi:hypothetical protein SKC41_30650 [Mycobacterium sp. 050128]